MTTTVYRVEHFVTGEGPYIRRDKETNYSIRGLHAAHNGSTAHPGPYGDDVIADALMDRHSFGFGTREQLDKWFHGFKGKLHEKDFVIRVFEAPEHSTTVSDYQAVFIKEDSKLIETHPVLRGARLP